MLLRRRAWVAALALALVSSTAVSVDAVSDAASGASADDDDDDGAAPAPATSASSALTAGAAAVVKQLNQTGDAMLIRRVAGFWTPAKTPICQNAPFILSRDGPSNQNCVPALHDLGLSCTCLTGFGKKTSPWEFHVTQKMTIKGTPPKAVAATSTLELTKISPFALTQAVKILNIIGDGDMGAITFMDDITKNGDKSSPKAETSQGSKANLTTVHFENVDFGSGIANVGFFHSTLVDLTLRNCNLADGSTSFFSTLASLKTVNLENNRFTQIPPELLQLAGVEQVLLSGNLIVNATVTEKGFQIIRATKAFNMDPSASAQTCADGVLKSTHDITFCVSDTLRPAPVPGVPPQKGGSNPSGTTVATDAPASNTTKYLLIGAIAGSVVVVILIFLIVRRRSSRKKEEAFVKQQTPHSILEDTLSFDHSKDSQQSAIDSSLLNDPIIITHRIPHNDVKVATCISRGGFGLVYSGTFNRRRVAIKRIRSELSADIKYIEAFLKEICLMASLSHPRIVEFVGVSWDSLRNLSAVTEFMERGDLRDVLHSSKERNARLSWDGHKSRIAMHIAEALTYLHSLSPKVIHRDLKSKNVLLDIDMTAKLSDFGVSRERRFEETHMTAGIGTAFWIAPEVLLGMDYDERADIFSFGVVLSEIDTDDYPYWNEKNPASGGKQQENVILRMVATGALRPEFSASCPRAILELAFECLDVDPLKRPTAAEIAYRLQQLIKSSPLTAESVFSTA